MTVVPDEPGWQVLACVEGRRLRLGPLESQQQAVETLGVLQAKAAQLRGEPGWQAGLGLAPVFVEFIAGATWQELLADMGAEEDGANTTAAAALQAAGAADAAPVKPRAPSAGPAVAAAAGVLARPAPGGSAAQQPAGAPAPGSGSGGGTEKAGPTAEHSGPLVGVHWRLTSWQAHLSLALDREGRPLDKSGPTRPVIQGCQTHPEAAVARDLCVIWLRSHTSRGLQHGMNAPAAR